MSVVTCFARRIPQAALLTAASLAALMLATRLGHFGEISQLPDASWAVFFLGGLLLRRAGAFAAFCLLAWVVDVAAMRMGTPADCFSPAYLFLLPAHAALWWAGRAGFAASRAAGWQRLGGTLLRLPFAVIAAFVVSNAGFFAFGPVPPGMSVAAYGAAVAGYLPAYLLTATAWVFAVLALREAVHSLREARVAG